MPKMTREELLDALHEMRIRIAKLPDTDPLKAELQTLAKNWEQFEKQLAEMDEIDPDFSQRVEETIGNALREANTLDEAEAKAAELEAKAAELEAEAAEWEAKAKATNKPKPN